MITKQIVQLSLWHEKNNIDTKQCIKVNKMLIYSALTILPVRN